MTTNTKDDFEKAQDERYDPTHKPSTEDGDEGGSLWKGAGSDDNPLKDQEAGATDAKGADDDNLYSGEPAKQATPGKKQKRARFKKRTSIIAGGGVGLIALSSMLFSATAIQLTHVSQLLQDFHMGPNQEVQVSRTTRLYRYMKYPDSPERRRVGYVGEKYGTKMLNRLSANGITMTPNSNGRFALIEVDLARHPDFDFDKVSSSDYDVVRSSDGTRATISAKTNASGAVTASPAVQRQVIGEIGRAGGVSRFTAVQNRVLSRMSGVAFDPLRVKGSNTAKDTIINNIKNRRKKSKVDTDLTVDITGDSDPETPGQQQTTEVASTVESEFESGKGSTGDSPGANKARARAKLAAGLVGAAGLGVFCTARAAFQAADQVEYLNKIAPLINIGVDYVASGDQVKAGQDVNQIAAGYFVQQLNTGSTKEVLSENGESEIIETGAWLNAKSLRQELGLEGGQDIPQSAKLSRPEDKSGFESFVTQGPINSICGALSTTIGQVFGIALSFAGGIVDIGIDLLIEGAMYLWFDDLVNVLAGEEVDVEAVGADLGNFMNYGTRLSANQQAIAMGGRELSEAEEIAWDNKIDEQNRALASQKSIWNRLFARDDANSLVTRLAYSSAGGSSVISGASSISRNLASVLLSPITAQGQTDIDYDYGFPQFGFSIEELEDPRFDNPFENIEILDERFVGDVPVIDYFNAEHSKDCFGVTIYDEDSADSGGSVIYHEGSSYIELEENCKWQEDFTLLNDFRVTGMTEEDSLSLLGDTWERYRFYILDTVIASSLACYEGDSKMCSEIGLTNFGDVPPGLECPANLGAPSPERHNYYLLPDALNGEYRKDRADSHYYGTKEMICTLYTAGKKFEASEFGSQATLTVGDINNKPNHATHRWGIAVDVYMAGEICVANHFTSGCSANGGKYSNDATILLGQAFVSTGIVDNIWWCEPGASGGSQNGSTGSMEAIRQYGASIGKPVDVTCIWDNDPTNNGHRDHFHVDISCEYKGFDEGTDLGNPSATCHN